MTSLLRATVFSLPLLFGVSSTALAAPSDASVEAPKKGKKGKKGKGKGKKGKHARGLCGQLSCTEAQAEQVGARVQTLREHQRAGRTRQQALHTSLSRELAKDKPSKKELERIHKDLVRMQSKTAEANLGALLDIHAVLDPAQRQQLSRMVERDGLRRLFKGSHHARGRGKPPAGAAPAPGQGPI